MIRNVLGKAVTKSTLISLPEYDRNSAISGEDLAMGALGLKNSQGKGKEEEEAVKQVDILKAQWAREGNGFALGWIYNASGGAITLVDSRNWKGRLVSSSLYPVRIENGQWGMFLHKQEYSGSSAAILYEGFNYDRQICYWCVAWRVKSYSTQVHVKIARDVDWYEDEWKSVDKELEKVAESHHRAKQEGWLSVISASPGPDAVFEALLTMEHL